MKFLKERLEELAYRSRPVRALWIEMKGGNEVSPKMGSRPVRALWIEIQLSRREFGERLSRPVRALWIEI